MVWCKVATQATFQIVSHFLQSKISEGMGVFICSSKCVNCISPIKCKWTNKVAYNVLKTLKYNLIFLG